MIGSSITCEVMLYLERQQAREVEAAAALREVCDGRGSRLDVLLGVQLAVEDHHHLCGNEIQSPHAIDAMLAL